MQSVNRFITAATLALASASSFASTTVYTSSAAFLANVASGAYTESFDGLPDAPATTFARDGFSYEFSVEGDIYGSGTYVSTSLPALALTINFTSNNVYAVGAEFFTSGFGLGQDFIDNVAMTVTLNDGTIASFTPSSQSNGYRGFTSDTLITSLIISGAPTSLYTSLDNLTVGTTIPSVPAVPEPTTWALMALGLAGIGFAARRKA